MRTLFVTTLVLAVGAPTLAGPLSPPGAPTDPTYKTLTEVEPRIAINATNTPGDATDTFIITQPGSYYLTDNLAAEFGKNGIRIAASSVTLDLNGFVLEGAGSAPIGIRTAAFLADVVIENGSVRNFANQGISISTDSGRLEDLRVLNCGSWGIEILGGAFGAEILRCYVSATGTTASNTGGIFVTADSVVRECVIDRVTGAAIQAQSRCHIIDNHITRPNTNAGLPSTARGVYLPNNFDTIVQGNKIIGTSSGYGIDVAGFGGNVVDSNTISFAGTGIRVLSSDNLIVRNVVENAGTAFSTAVNNKCYVVAAPNAAGIFGSSGGSSFTGDPYANVVH
ncbi:MAG: NosD domain-containing protein [Phycisphaerales bacterium JB043]